MKKTNVKKIGELIEMCFNYDDDKSVSILLNKPNWDITVESFKYLYDSESNLDLIKPGKLIFDYCTIEYSPELDDNIQLLMSVCSHLTSKFVLPVNVNIEDEKKNTGLTEKV